MVVHGGYFEAEGLAFTILAEAALSFLGLGTQPPTPVEDGCSARVGGIFKKLPGSVFFSG
jgi:hypothetical protein